MATDFQTIPTIHFMIGMMDHVGREPEHLALEFTQDFEGLLVVSGAVHFCSLLARNQFRLESGSANS